MSKKEIIGFIVMILVIVILSAALIIQKINNKTSYNISNSEIPKLEETYLTEEEELNLTTYDDTEVVNHVHITNLDTLAIYDPPATLVGNLSNSLYLWLKYETGDSNKVYEYKIDGVSYNVDDKVITFNVINTEDTFDIVKCIYYSHRDFYDFKRN